MVTYQYIKVHYICPRLCGIGLMNNRSKKISAHRNQNFQPRISLNSPLRQNQIKKLKKKFKGWSIDYRRICLLEGADLLYCLLLKNQLHSSGARDCRKLIRCVVYYSWLICLQKTRQIQRQQTVLIVSSLTLSRKQKTFIPMKVQSGCWIIPLKSSWQRFLVHFVYFTIETNFWPHQVMEYLQKYMFYVAYFFKSRSLFVLYWHVNVMLVSK